MRTLQAVLRIAVRLTTVGVIAPITRIVTAGEATMSMVVVAALNTVVVAVLLYLAYRIERDRQLSIP